jgi:trans-AT polyketide synthase/acyltransferase/oxidoreductase domain-containing protein
MSAIIFSGQGTQKKGMGQEFFAQYPTLVNQCSDLLGYSIEELCLHNPENKLNQTEYAQPALFFVNMLAYLNNKATLPTPSYFLGHSLGEYNALCAAGAFDILTGIQLVQKRGLLMAKAPIGGMVAILGATTYRIQEILTSHGFGDIDIANHNTFSQFVLSGPKERIVACSDLFKEQGITAIILNVGGAFHSRYMQQVEKEFHDFVKTFAFQPLHTPIISNVTGQKVEDSMIPSLLSKQISHAVHWQQSITYLLEKKIYQFHEIHSQILSKMVREIQESHPIPEHPTKSSLGSISFKELFRVRHAYVSGSMYRGIASPDLVIRMGKAGLLSFYGTGGLAQERIREGIQTIQRELSAGQSFGVNLLANYVQPHREMQTIELFLQYGIQIIEASAFVTITPALAYYVIKGLYREPGSGNVLSRHHIFAKISRPTLARLFMNPIPGPIVQELLENGKISEEEAKMALKYPVSTSICVEGDSGGHTDRKQLLPLLLSVLPIRKEMQNRYPHIKIYIGAAGGLGDPMSIGLCFSLGADFILTGSINQCSIEAGTSDKAKDLLQAMGVEDTDYSIAGDMFEIGAKVQVLKKGVLYPGRANTLFNIYTLFNSLDEIPSPIRTLLEEQYFRMSFEEASQQVEHYFGRAKNPKGRMAILFRWYLHTSNEWAIRGTSDRVIDYQIHTGPALGLFNQWVKGRPQESWKSRHVDWIADALMDEAATYRKF